MIILIALITASILAFIAMMKNFLGMKSEFINSRNLNLPTHKEYEKQPLVEQEVNFRTNLKVYYDLKVNNILLGKNTKLIESTNTGWKVFLSRSKAKRTIQFKLDYANLGPSELSLTPNWLLIRSYSSGTQKVLLKKYESIAFETRKKFYLIFSDMKGIKISFKSKAEGKKFLNIFYTLISDDIGKVKTSVLPKTAFEKEFVLLYESGARTDEIRKKLKLSSDKLNYYLKKFEYETNYQQNLDNDEIIKLEERIKNGDSFKAIDKDMGLTQGTSNNYALDILGISRKKEKEKTQKQRNTKIFNDYNKKLSIREISKKYGLTTTSIRNIIDEKKTKEEK